MDIKEIVCNHREAIVTGIDMLLERICEEEKKGDTFKLGRARKSLRFYVELLSQAADDEGIDNLERVTGD